MYLTGQGSQILPLFRPLRTGLLVPVFSVFHLFILVRYLILPFLPVRANLCLSGPLVTCVNIKSLTLLFKLTGEQI